MKVKSLRYCLLACAIAIMSIGGGIILSKPSAVAIEILAPVCNSGSPSNATSKDSGICKDNSNAGKNALGSINDPILGQNGILAIALNVMSFIGGLIAVFVIIISGIEIITSSGDSNTMKEKRKAIIYACAGLVIVVLAQFIVRFVLGRVVV